MRHKYPKYTHGFVDHDGSPRFYFRVPGRKRVPLPGLPWSPEFMEAREKALTRRLGGPRARRQPHERRHRERCHRVLLPIERLHRRSCQEVRSRMRRAILERFREAHGEKRIALLHKKALQAILNKKSPAAASNWRKALRGFIDHCMSLDMLTSIR